MTACTPFGWLEPVKADDRAGQQGVARNVLTDRLNRLVGEGVLERVPYSERPTRYEYRLTAKGRDLNIALSGLRQWGDKYLNEKPPRLLRRKADKKPVIAAFVPKGADVLRFDELELVPGPGLKAG
jgi:HxlR-like helix-turn-helix